MGLHVMGCIFTYFGQLDYPNWIIKQNYQNSSFIYIYTTSVYFILTSLTTCGYGDITSVNKYELSLTIIILAVGIIIYSWGLTEISDYIKMEDSKTIDFEEKCLILDELKLTYKKFSAFKI